MKKIIAVLLSLMFVFLIASLSLAIEEKKIVPPELPYAAGVKQITGEVRSVNLTDMSLTVTKKVGDKTVEVVVAVDERTKIKKDDMEKTFTAIKVGDQVVVKYLKIDRKQVAKNISIKSDSTSEK
ncbi:MAG: hypothetical protein IBX72_04660 [Nitrospirae bacterium]|jgi:ribosomal protein S1|nr:hypothetical protein [Nitrospirota bacterium]